MCFFRVGLLSWIKRINNLYFLEVFTVKQIYWMCIFCAVTYMLNVYSLGGFRAKKNNNKCLFIGGFQGETNISNVYFLGGLSSSSARPSSAPISSGSNSSSNILWSNTSTFRRPVNTQQTHPWNFTQLNETHNMVWIC